MKNRIIILILLLMIILNSCILLNHYPASVDEVEIDFQPGELFGFNDYLITDASYYGFDEEKVIIMEFSEPDTMKIINEITYTHKINSLLYEDSKLYILHGSRGDSLEVLYQVNDDPIFRHIHDIEINGYPHRINTFRDFIFISAYDSMIILEETSNSCEIISRVSIGKKMSDAVVVGDSILYIGIRDNGIGVYNINSLPSLIKIGTCEIPDAASIELITIDQYLYAADEFKGIYIYDISDVSKPVLIDTINRNGIRHLQIDNNNLYIYFISTIEGFDVTDPSSPQSIFTYKTRLHGAMLFLNNYFFIAETVNKILDYPYYIEIIDKNKI